MKKSSLFTWGKLWQPLVILLLLNMAMMRSVSAKPAQSIWVEPQLTDNLYANDTFTVDVKINITDPDPTKSPPDGMWGFEYKLNWSSSILHVVSIQYHVPSGWTSPFEVVNSTSDTSGDGYADLHWVSLTTLMGTPFTGVTSLCTYTFRVIYELEYNGTLDIYDDKLVHDDAALIPHTTDDGEYRVLEDNTPPTIDDPSRTPPGDIQPNQNVTVSVNVTDAETGVKNVTLSYTTDNGTSWTPVEMIYNSTSGLYEATIPGQEAWTWVKFNITAYDNAGNSITRDGTEPYFVYQVIPEFPAALIMVLFIAATLVAVLLGKKAWPRKRRSPSLSTRT